MEDSETAPRSRTRSAVACPSSSGTNPRRPDRARLRFPSRSPRLKQGEASMHTRPFQAFVFASVALLIAATSSNTALAASPTATLPFMDDAGMSPRFATMGGAGPLATDKTVAHWHGQFTD